MELIKITTNAQNEQLISGRELHTFLEINEQYTHWISRMIDYGFAENIDYTPISEKRLIGHGKGLTDHILIISMAKEISMIQRTPKGKEARLYFIECEKKLKALQQPTNYIEALKALVTAEEEKLKLLESNENLKTELNTSLKHCTIMKFNQFYKLKWDMPTCKRNGKQASAYCRVHGHEIKKCKTNDERFSEVNSYPLEVLEKLFLDRSIL
jgi:phage anti-repressor protein